MVCECGCGGQTRIATKNDRRAGQVKGQPLRFIYGHSRKRAPEIIAQVKVGTGLCECGCGKKTSISTRTVVSRGLVKGQPKRFISSHTSMIKDPLSLYIIDSNTGCWIWQGRMETRGWYGTFGPNPAHRVVYEKIKGSIPDNLELDHLCKVKSCVNPDHLEPVTGLINMRRAHEKLTEKHIPIILKLIESGRSRKSIADKFSVDKKTVFNLFKRYGTNL